MKIALFASAFYPSLGGVEEVVRQEAHALRRAGHEVIVLAQRWPRDLPDFEEFEGIPLYRLAFRSPAASLKAKVTFALRKRATKASIRAILQRHGSEILHVHCVSANAYYALRAARDLELPLVVTTHGERTMDATGVYDRSAFLNSTLRDCVTHAAHFSACSQNTLDDVRHYVGDAMEGRSSVIHSGIRVADFGAQSPETVPRPYILGVGRFVPQKGFDLLIEAFARARLDDFDLVLAGDGEERENLQQCAHDLGIEGAVRFVGRVERPRAVALFLGCAWFVLPSRREPQGIVNLEAMAASKAVIAARVGGVPEIVTEGETGLLFEGENVAELVQLLERLAGDAALRQRLGAAGQKRAAQFDWDTITARHIEVYESVLEQG